MTELTKEEEYDIISKHLGRITSLRKFSQTKDFEWLEDVRNKMDALLGEMRDEYEIKKRKAEELEEKRQKALEYILSLGLSPETLSEPVTISGLKSKPKKSASEKKAKYHFNDEQGNIKEWSGVGRTPSVINKLIEEGYSLEDFLIVEEKKNSV